MRAASYPSGSLTRLWGRVGRPLGRVGGVPALVLLGLALLWEAWTRLFAIEPYLLPAPSRILGAFVADPRLYAAKTWETAQETVIGFAAAVLVGLAVAFAVDASAPLRRAIYPLLIASQTIPLIAVAPIIIIWLGYDLTPKVVIVVLYCFFPIVVATVDGLRAADPEMLNMLRAMGASRAQLLRVARLPAALPSVFAGVKIAATYAVTGAVVGEWLGGDRGLGISMIRAQKSFALDRVFAAVFVVMVLTLVLFLAIDLVARRAMPWYVSSRKEYAR